MTIKIESKNREKNRTEDLKLKTVPNREILNRCSLIENHIKFSPI